MTEPTNEQTVLICGAGGQLGSELQAVCPVGVRCVALGRGELDIADSDAVLAAIDRTGASKIINAAAYTAVDKAESDQESAYRVNAQGPKVLAEICAARGLRLLHVSTDFVFDGAQGSPYHPQAATQPLGVYGASKLAGEQAVLAAGADALVLRTGWVYSRYGGNFVKTMLRLLAERDRLTVVEDQVGTPTWARGLAQTSWALLLNPAALGTYHWSDAGAASWYDFASAIRELGLELGLLNAAAEIAPIPASDYPTPAARPPYSVLDKASTRALLGNPGRHWREQLRDMLMDMKAHRELLV